MLNRAGAIVLASGVLLLLSACAPKPTTPTINESMTKVMAVHAQTIWDMTSKAFNDKGDGLDASKLSDQDWARLAYAGQQLSDRALVLANAAHVTVKGEGETVMGEDINHQGQPGDAATAKEIQGFIDANPGLFADKARKLAESGTDLVKAAKTKDVAVAYRVSAGLDEVCDGCHEKFWGTDEPPEYPGKPNVPGGWIKAQ